MTDIFLHLFNMSITAGWLAIAVMLFRVVFKKAPKSLTVVLWALVGVRLLFPVSVESVLSLIPSSQTVPTDIMYAEIPSIHTGIYAVNTIVNTTLSETLAPAPSDSVNPMQVVTTIACIVWLVGMAAMLLYTAVSYLRLHSKVKEAAPLEQNVFQCDRVASPFILGMFRPRIYLPSDMNDTDIPYVLAHERAHIKRCDHLWKPLGFLLLTVYWFNPVLWVAYVLLCRDIETACDQKVLATLGTEIKKPYADALINCSIKRKTIAACPLAFGEVSVAQRVKSVLYYKKPAVWLIVLAVIASIVIAVCFLTDPKAEDKPSEDPSSEVSVSADELLDYRNAIAFVKNKPDLDANHRPLMGEERAGAGINGSMLAQYLSEVSWTETDAPPTELDEMGSVTFWINGYENGITVYAKKDGDAFAYASAVHNSTVSQDKEIRYYRASDGDYQKAVSLLRRGYHGFEEVNYADGTVFFYGESVHERKNTNSAGIRYASFDQKTFDRLLKELKKQEWIDDYLREREELWFDGSICLDEAWLFFGFEQKVVYYGKYYCTASDKVMDMLKDLKDTTNNQSELMQRYPQLFGLDISDGLTVACGQMAMGSFSWSLQTSKTMQQFSVSETLYATREDLHEILAYYGLQRGDVKVAYKSIVYSSFGVGIPAEYSRDEYNRFLDALFWGDVDEWGIQTEVGTVRDGTLELLIEPMVTDRTMSETLTTSPRYEIKSASDGKTVLTADAESKTLMPLETQTVQIELGDLPKGEYELCITVISDLSYRTEERTYTVPFEIK